MEQLKIQEATTRILTSYLASHKVEPSQISGLIASVGQALAPTTAPAEPEVAIPSGRRQRRRSRPSNDADIQRIEHPDQSDMFNETEAVVVEALIGETVGDEEAKADPDFESEDLPEAEARSKRGPRSGREIAEAEAETVVEHGVPITRIPEVRRRHRA